MDRDFQSKRFGRRSWLKSATAFSRVELLVTIVCVLALAIAGYWWGRKFSASSKSKSCQNNVRALLRGFDGFLTASNHLPDGARRGEPHVIDWLHWQSDRYFEDSAVAPYVPNFGSKILQCPSDAQVRYREYPFSYSMNVYLERLHPSKLVNASDLILLFEEASPNDGACAISESTDKLTTRHSKQSTGGFLDGRVESILETNAVAREHFRPRLKRKE